MQTITSFPDNPCLSATALVCHRGQTHFVLSAVPAGHQGASPEAVPWMAYAVEGKDRNRNRFAFQTNGMASRTPPVAHSAA